MKKLLMVGIASMLMSFTVLATAAPGDACEMFDGSAGVETCDTGSCLSTTCQLATSAPAGFNGNQGGVGIGARRVRGVKRIIRNSAPRR